ncbi:ABC transporter permease [Amycolatopsis sp. CA-230715]|uniref:ABC transporter permease n=1 Tax=Amycolatopsis sp. CA-230715 TaxID=2745196 RepID=UPI0020B290D1|nr:ABC transporter permease [Amycolatopsis sp. CA-230715]
MPEVDDRSTPRGAAPVWLSFLARRLLRLVVSLFVLVTLAFAMIHLIPGDPVRTALGSRATPELVQARQHALWLDRPLLEQYWHYLHGLFTGDLGTSFTTNLPVAEVLGERLPNSALLAGLAFAVIMLVSVPLGMLVAAATRTGRRRGTELVFTGVTGVLATVPEFLIGVGLVFVFAVRLQWLPVAGQDGPVSYLLPVAALSLGSIAALTRIVRAETLRVLGEDYLRVARGKRLPTRLLYLRHVLPNMLTATLTLGGLLLAGLVGGTVLVENVFAWPGVGTLVVNSVVQRDYPLAQAVILVLGATVLLVNVAVDLLLGLLDPRSTIRRT